MVFMVFLIWLKIFIAFCFRGGLVKSFKVILEIMFKYSLLVIISFVILKLVIFLIVFLFVFMILLFVKIIFKVMI